LTTWWDVAVAALRRTTEWRWAAGMDVDMVRGEEGEDLDDSGADKFEL
jgi:hypothetical protein